MSGAVRTNGPSPRPMRPEDKMSQTAEHRGDARETYDVQAVQEKWLPIWDELAPFRAGIPQGELRQLVSEGPDGAGQRTGHRRPVRTLRHTRHQEEADSVVLQDH